MFVHSNAMPGGKVFSANVSIVWSAWPELYPGALSPRIFAVGKRLYLSTRIGPTSYRALIKVPIGIILPSLFLMNNCEISSGFRRNLLSPWTLTCQVLLNLLKSFTYADPRYVCSVLNTLCRGIFSARAFV